MKKLDRESLAPRWLEWARQVQALAQTGMQYALNDYQRERYSQLMDIAVEIVNEHMHLPFGDLSLIFHNQSGYATPRVDVRGAVFQNGKLLFVRERADGGWTFPGGWADVGDRPAQSAEREVREESGFRVKAQRVIGVYDANRVMPLDLFHGYKIVFLCDLVGGEATPSKETSEVAFFGPDEIPDPLSLERTHPRHIRAAFAMLADPGRPTEFD